jgi:hypothetical protein
VLNDLQKLKTQNWTYLVKDRNVWCELVQKTETHRGLWCQQKKEKKNRVKASRIHKLSTRWLWLVCLRLRPQYREEVSHWKSLGKLLRRPEQCFACRHRMRSCIVLTRLQVRNCALFVVLAICVNMLQTFRHRSILYLTTRIGNESWEHSGSVCDLSDVTSSNCLCYCPYQGLLDPSCTRHFALDGR